MQRIVKSVDHPVIFTYNVMLNVYKYFGKRHFEHIEQELKQQTNLVGGAVLLPIISYPEDSIESRAKQASQKIPEILKQLSADKAHLISFSTSGVDMRYLISEFGGNSYIKSLSTIAAPHKGAKVITAFERRMISEGDLQGVSRLVGVDQTSFQEYRPSNIRDFNSFITNSPDVQYFSVGAEQMQAHCSDSLKNTNRALFTDINKARGAPIDNDGVFCHDEVAWGNHLLNFNADHSDLVGLGRNNFNHKQVVDLLIDNVKYHFGTPLTQQ